MIKEKYSSRIKETTLSVVQTRVESIRKKDISKTGLRIYKDGYIGVSGAIGDYSEEELEKRAREALDLKIPYDYEISQDKKERMEICPEIIDESQFLNEMETFLEELRNQQPDFSFFHKIRLVDRETSLVNDMGLDLQFKDRYIALELGIKDKASSNLFDAFTGYEGRKYDRNEMIKFTNDICNAYKNKVKLPQGTKFPVIFNASDHLFLKQLMIDLHGQRFATGSSLLSGKIGEQVFNENFTLYQSLNPEDTLKPFFDAEGIVNENYRYPLIENGRLVSPYTDKKIASKYNLPLTGSSAADYDGVPSLAFLNLKVKESDYTLKELLQGQMGILVMIASGGDFTPNGDFGTPVQLAFLFDGEKLIGRLPDIQLSSNVFDMFGKDFVGAGNNNLFPLDSEKYIVMNLNVSKA
jgi:PmbA protein